MKLLPTGEPVWELEFDEKGRLTSPAEGDLLGQIAGQGVTELFVLSHGWGTSTDGARRLYDAMFPLIRTAGAGTPGLGPIGFAGIYWPSLWFPPTEATPPRAAGSAQADGGGVVDLDAGTAKLSGAEIAASLLPGFTDAAQRETLAEIGRLIDEGTAMAASGAPDAEKEQHLQQIHLRLQSLVPAAPDGEFEDAGETALLLSPDPAVSYQAAAEAFGTVPPGSSTQGIGDWFGNAINGAKDALRVFSYSTMKARAGDIGRVGLGPLLARLHGGNPGVRVHLIGHSFGARLVSFALAGVGRREESPVSSLLLLQAAFSHWSFAHAQDNPFGSAGALHTVADRVHGPLVATFSTFDWAVGVWYPKASFLAREDSQAAAAGRWGGLGADGFQAVAPLEDRHMPVAGGTGYGFTPGAFYRVDAADVINHTEGEPFSGAHSDIRRAQVADLAVAAATTR